MSESTKRSGASKAEKKSTSLAPAKSAGEKLRDLLDKNAASELLAELKERDVPVGELGGKVKDVAGQIWLAGLGAYAKVEKEGSKWFDTLVKDGERLEEKTRELVDRQWTFYRDKVDDVRGKVEEVKDMATNSIDRIEKAFDERVANALARLNIPSKQDIDHLNQQIYSLQRELAALKKAPTSGSRSATKASAQPKTSTQSKAAAAKSKTAKSKGATEPKKASKKAAPKSAKSGAAKSATAKRASTKKTAPKKKTTPA